MGEHKRNPTAIYFKENPWAPDFRGHFGKRTPRGKGIRRVYKILMELERQSGARSAESGEKRAESSEPVKESQAEKGGYRPIKSKYFENLVRISRFKLSNIENILSSLRLLYLPLVKRFKNV